MFRIVILQLSDLLDSSTYMVTVVTGALKTLKCRSYFVRNAAGEQLE